MRSKIYFPEHLSETFEEVFASFIISQTSKGVAAVTIRNYHLHLRSISKYLDITMPFCSLTKRHLESMVVSMRAAGLAHNTVATYLRVINTFLNWANREGLTSVSIPNIKEKDTVIDNGICQFVAEMDTDSVFYSTIKQMIQCSLE